MRGSHQHSHSTRAGARTAATVYGSLLVVAGYALIRAPGPDAGTSASVLATLFALSVCGQLASHRLRAHVGHVFDMDLALILVAVAIAGPRAGFAVGAVSEAAYLARRGRAFVNLGLLADLVSIAAMAITAATVIAVIPGDDPALRTVGLFAAGLATAAANYAFARLGLGVLRDGEHPLRIIRREFLPVLPLELASIVIGVFSVRLLPDVGVAALLAFAALVYLPQLAVARLLHAPSVARLSVDEAAAVYRAALADELDLTRGDRRAIEQTDALVERRRLPGAGLADPLGPIQDALVVTICARTSPQQTAFSARPRAQVVLVARRWAGLTARCTPALSHPEALRELRHGPLLCDAPQALAAAERIVDRERRLTEHVAGVPRLHRTPVPRELRRTVLPRALARLAA